MNVPLRTTPHRQTCFEKHAFSIIVKKRCSNPTFSLRLARDIVSTSNRAYNGYIPYVAMSQFLLCDLSACQAQSCICLCVATAAEGTVCKDGNRWLECFFKPSIKQPGKRMPVSYFHPLPFRHTTFPQLFAACIGSQKLPVIRSSISADGKVRFHRRKISLPFNTPGG